VKCYLDKSDGIDDGGDVWLTQVGFAASDAMWHKFNDRWRRVLWERYPIAPYLHMTHLLSGKDPFIRGVGGWSEEAQSKLIRDSVFMLQQLDKREVFFSRCSVNVSARARLVAQGHPVPDEIELCRDLCVGAICQWRYLHQGKLDELFSIFFDQGEEFYTPFKRRWQMRRTPPDRVSVRPESFFWDMIREIEQRNAKYCYPLQPADMLSWAHSRSLLSVDRPHRSLSYMIEQVVPNVTANVTEDIMRRKHPKR
jgi:hypothetical protein